jgi:genome maintenance exonuclease 1
MLLVKKYDYKPLEREESEGGRRYIVGESKSLPSVTTILSKTKDMTHLKEWINRVGEDQANKIKVEASSLGTGMHKNLENYIFGKPISGSFMSQALAKVIIRQGLSKVNEVWGNEVSLYAKSLYAGTTDLVGLHNNIPSIIDFKNSIRLKDKSWIEDYFMQLTAYALAHNEMFDTNINRGVVMIATRDAQFQEFIIEGDEFTHYQNMWIDKLYQYYNKYS